IGGLMMDRVGRTHPRLNSRPTQGFHDLLPVLDEKRVEEPRVDCAGRNMLELDMVLLNEGFGVGRCDFGSLPQEGVESTKLREAGGRVEIGQSIVLDVQRMEGLDAGVLALVT